VVVVVVEVVVEVVEVDAVVGVDVEWSTDRNLSLVGGEYTMNMTVVFKTDETDWETQTDDEKSFRNQLWIIQRRRRRRKKTGRKKHTMIDSTCSYLYHHYSYCQPSISVVSLRFSQFVVVLLGVSGRRKRRYEGVESVEM
jgi:hypothetical protein